MSKPSSPKSPKPPKDGTLSGEKKALDLGVLMQRLDEAVAKTIEDYSELFVTNVKEQRSVLEDCRDYIDQIGRENEEMTENFRRREEAFTLQETQTEEIAEKQARIEDLEAQLAQKVTDIEGLHAHYNIEMRKIVDEERPKGRHHQVKFGARVEELHNRLERVESFIQRQDEVEARMEAAEKEMDEVRAQMAIRHPASNANTLKNCLVYKEEMDKELEDLMFKVKEDIGNRVGDRVKEVLAENEILRSEIYMHTSSTLELQMEADKSKAENRKLRGEIDLKSEAEELHCTRNRHQRHVIWHNNSKILNLEKSLQQVIRQFSEERRILLEKQACIVAELKADNMKLKNLVLQKAQELKKFRQLAEIVIRQRGEVELFLLDSIHYVKNQVYLQKKIQSNQTAEPVDSVSNVNCTSRDSSSISVFTLPPIHKAPASWPGAGSWPRENNPDLSNNNSNNNGGIHDVNSLAGASNMNESQAEAHINFQDSSHDPFTVPVILPMIDISDLSWEEREKVLRYLFKKINTARNHQLQTEHAKKSQENFQGVASTEAVRTIV